MTHRTTLYIKTKEANGHTNAERKTKNNNPNNREKFSQVLHINQEEVFRIETETEIIGF